MEAPLEYLKPENWQDFETLCMKMWGEYWQCPEIKKNGRSGQHQKGVDISAKPKGQTSYYGIQCKLKSTGRSKLLETEVDSEVEAALDFRPALGKLYIATTADKDAAIEEYVRLKNEEQISKGLFEVHLYSWQDITVVLAQCPDTLNFYLNNHNFRTSQRMAFIVNGESSKLDAAVPFFQKVTDYVTSHNSKRTALDALLSQHTKRMERILGTQMAVNKALSRREGKKKINRSLLPLKITIKNEGTVPLEHFKINLEIQGNHLGIVQSNVASDNTIPLLISRIANPLPSTKINGNWVTIFFHNKILVGGDQVTKDSVFIKISHSQETNLVLKWEMLSKSYRASGEFTVKVTPQVRKKRTEIIVETLEEEKTIKEDVEDYIEQIEEGAE